MPSATGQRTIPLDREAQRGDEIHAEAAPVLQAVHAVDVRESHQAERREHEDPDPRAEVPAVDPDQQLAGEQGERWRARRERVVVARTRGASPRTSAQERPLREEQRRRAEHEPRHDAVERRARRVQQQHRADRAADEARHGEEAAQRRAPVELAAIADHAAQRRGQQRDRARRVRDDRRQSGRDERGEGEQRAAAGDRVDDPGQQRRTRADEELCGRDDGKLMRGRRSGGSTGVQAVVAERSRRRRGRPARGNDKRGGPSDATRRECRISRHPDTFPARPSARSPTSSASPGRTWT